ncbi:MAG: flagellar protein export ATPase FliI [Candidatus Glassbacteria bacterium RIFCSPLOWO2_12_FULL_58_11]|uniref:Flagellar protein export ATPase FliI n=1 Tax=Candidatus Glassbacteria bacterium RIFCSPLOWO2_12_FULL_58_11 TaxID=1817867 RepID=A0A1F5YLJ5_9BACT|nr:MAG: flagellar protein export ATPase FliI [Candidatus Glassbacteria bacterium RIFCSPLOWO2_12_FULL_58_11]
MTLPEQTSERRSHFDRFLTSLDHCEDIVLNGKVNRVVGLIIDSIGPAVSLGQICRIRSRDGSREDKAEVVGFKENNVLLMPLGSMEGIAPGCEVIADKSMFSVEAGPSLLGRVLDGLGSPIDGRGPLNLQKRVSAYRQPPSPMERSRINETMPTGIRAIDSLLTCGKGQRVGIFSGSGVGKSVMLGMIARNTGADVNVIALIGERGREVRDFIERDLGEEGLKRSVVIAATSDQPALVRLKGAFVATAIAEYFRDQGMDVMLLMDSITRMAMAQREIGLAVGEPPTTKGYTPSVFAMLPRLVERAGKLERGSITGLYAVLVDGDDMDEPIADAMRSILDGHVVLSRKLASMNHYPAIDVLNSISRVMIDVVSSAHRKKVQALLETLAVYRESEDLINIGAYHPGSNPNIDRAIRTINAVNAFLRQDIDEHTQFAETVEKLEAVYKLILSAGEDEAGEGRIHQPNLMTA